MATMMNDTLKTARHGVESVREGTEHTLANTFSAMVKGVNAVSGVIAMLRSFDRDDGLAWLGLARRRPLRSAVMFSAGLTMGAGLGVLFAPMAGADLRRTLLARLTPAQTAEKTASGEKQASTASQSRASMPLIRPALLGGRPVNPHLSALRHHVNVCEACTQIPAPSSGFGEAQFRPMQQQTLAGKVALVTGSTSGVGRATALSFAREGAAVVIINGRDPETGERVRQQLAALAPASQVHYVRADMNSRDDIEMLFARAIELGGGLDIFVHSGYGGSGLPDLFENMTVEDLEDSISGIFTSLVRCCHYAVPILRARGGGAILGVISDAAKVPTAGEAVHGGALAGSGMFLRGLAREVARYQIRTNAVCPSLIRDTRNYERVMAGGFARELFKKIEKRAQLGLPGPDDLANLITFLVGPLASHITGQMVSINGGISGA